MTEKNELDLFVGLMKSPEREQKFVFSLFLFSESVVSLPN